MNFFTEESKENDLIIEAATGNIKLWTIRNLLFSLTLQVVRLNNQGAPLLGLAKSIYYYNKLKAILQSNFGQIGEIYEFFYWSQNTPQLFVITLPFSSLLFLHSLWLKKATL